MAAGRPREFNYDDALEKAMQVFWKKGFEGTSMPDLTEAMGMNRPSIYASFGNKEELFHKAFGRYQENSEAFFRDALNAPTAREAMERFLCGAACAFSSNKNPRGCMAVQGALACSDSAEPIRQAAIAKREDVFNLVHERLKKGVIDGDLQKSADPKALARFFTAVLHGMAVQSAGGLKKDDLNAVATQALSVLPE